LSVTVLERQLPMRAIRMCVCDRIAA